MAASNPTVCIERSMPIDLNQKRFRNTQKSLFINLLGLRLIEIKKIAFLQILDRFNRGPREFSMESLINYWKPMNAFCQKIQNENWFTRNQCGQMLKEKVAKFFPHLPKSFKFKKDVYQIAPKVAIYLGCFCQNICKYSPIWSHYSKRLSFIRPLTLR